MPTTYQILDAILAPDGATYRVTVQVNKDSQGNQVFISSAPRIRDGSLSPGDAAVMAAWILSTGVSLATLKTQSYTVS